MHAMINRPAACDGPLEFAQAIPPAVQGFANELVRTRALATPLEASQIPPASSAEQLRTLGALKRPSAVPGYASWVHWVSDWVARFGALSDAGAVRLRMFHARHPSCPRFHTDVVPVRLIATLIGPGTQWLRGQDVVRSPEGRIGQLPDAGQVQQLAPGTVGLFQGAARGLNPGPAVVHRSPLVHEDRIVLTLDVDG